MDEYRRGRNG